MGTMLDLQALITAHRTTPDPVVLATQFGVNRSTIIRALHYAEIPTRGRGRPTLASILTPEQLQAHKDAQRLQRRVKWAPRNLRRKYGLTPEDVKNMYQAQQGRCGICDQSFPRLVVDHNHETGKVRALLCTRCNTGIGLFQENLETLQSAIQYLTDHAF